MSTATSNRMVELGIDKLSVEERIALAHDIWESLEETPISPLTEEQRIEFARREAEMDANPDICLTWDEIRTYVEANR